MKTHAQVMHAYGDASVFRWEEIDVPEPGPGQALIRHTAVGMNFADIYMREGHHAVLPLPAVPGLEGAGVIEAVGPGVTDFAIGDRVVYASGDRPGSYCEARIRSTDGLVKIPDWLDDKTAAAAFTKGTTVEYLFNRTHKLQAGETILLTAAAGGVGLIACQWAKSLGATVIGTVSTDAKAELAMANGCTHVIVAPRQNVAEQVKRITGGRGVDVVYDSIGKDSWADSLEAVKVRGLVVAFGNSSGDPPPFEPIEDGSVKSIYLHRATTKHYQTSDEIRRRSAASLFEKMRSGAVKITIGHEYALRDLPQGHRDVEARKTAGSVIFVP
ncbi:MAG: quinone oxidoreductase [Beijerinckiaceae bacterium]